MPAVCRRENHESNLPVAPVDQYQDSLATEILGCDDPDHRVRRRGHDIDSLSVSVEGGICVTRHRFLLARVHPAAALYRHQQLFVNKAGRRLENADHGYPG